MCIDNDRKTIEQLTRNDENISQLKSTTDEHNQRLSELEKFKNRSEVHIHSAILIAGFVGLSGLGAFGLSSRAIIKSETAIKNAEAAQESVAATVSNSIESIKRINSTANLYTFDTGMIIPSYSPNPPDGWLLCDGKTMYKIEDYPKLFELVKPFVIFDQDKFYTPNFTGRFLRGASIENPAGKLIDAQVGSHSHPMFGSRANTGGKPGPALNPAKYNEQHASYLGGTENDGWYEIRSAPDDGTKRGHTYENENEVEGNWPDHVTVYFIIKHDPPKRTEDESKISPTESD